MNWNNSASALPDGQTWFLPSQPTNLFVHPFTGELYSSCPPRWYSNPELLVLFLLQWKWNLLSLKCQSCDQIVRLQSPVREITKLIIFFFHLFLSIQILLVEGWGGNWLCLKSSLLDAIRNGQLWYHQAWWRRSRVSHGWIRTRVFENALYGFMVGLSRNWPSLMIAWYY